MSKAIGYHSIRKSILDGSSQRNSSLQITNRYFEFQFGKELGTVDPSSKWCCSYQELIYYSPRSVTNLPARKNSNSK